MRNCLKDAPHIPLIVGLRFTDSISVLIGGSGSKTQFSSTFPERRNEDYNKTSVFMSSIIL